MPEAFGAGPRTPKLHSVAPIRDDGRGIVGMYRQRRRWLERLRQAEAVLREREAAYLVCRKRRGAGPELDGAYAAVVAARQAADRAFAALQATDPPTGADSAYAARASAPSSEGPEASPACEGCAKDADAAS